LTRLLRSMESPLILSNLKMGRRHSSPPDLVDKNIILQNVTDYEMNPLVHLSGSGSL
jgi:hypothetical protein